MPLVKLANLTHFECQPEQTILDAARSNGIVLEHSCRTGRCGACKARVLSGQTTVLNPEASLTEEALSAGFILTCCRAAVADTQLDIEDLGEIGLIEPKILPCRIDSLQILSKDVIQVTLRTPPKNALPYLPGQYVNMIGRDGLRRSYSVANAPREDGKVTLHIRRVEKGKMSRYWFEEALINDLLRLEGPLGTFCLRENNSPSLIFLATGTGIAPIKAFLEALSKNHGAHTYHQIHLYWGGRTAEDIYWEPVFPELPLKFTPVLSRPSDWKGKTGYVQHALLQDGIDLSQAVVYACGSEAMIQSAYKQLTTAGLNNRNFYSDAFVRSSNPHLESV